MGQPLPLQISQSLGVTRVNNSVALVIACFMIDVVFVRVGGSRGLLQRLVHDLIYVKINKMAAFSLYPLCI
jgi:hypothetical protein